MANIERRRTKSGQTAFRVKVRLKGFPVQSATFEKLSDAKKWAQQTEVAIREGRHFKVAAKRHTLSQAIDRYLTHVMPNKPKSAVEQTIQLNWWRSHIGDYTLADITPALIVEHRDKLALGAGSKTRSNATLNCYMAALSHVFTVALREWNWIDHHPIHHLSRLKEPRGRVRFLDDDERKRLLTACKESSNPHLYLIVVLALSTGARKMEVLGLSWQDVDLSRAVITLHETKNNERRVLPLSGHALALMKKHSKAQSLNCNLVFPNQDKTKPMNITVAFEYALKRAGITDFRFHDLRHSAASYLAMSGASLAEIAEVLGHKTLAMVKRYSHLSEAHTSAVVAKMNSTIFG